VIVVGSGPVGLSFVKLGKLFGLGQIDIVDMLPAKLEVARRMGADHGYTPAEISTPEFIAAANRSYDAVIDAVGLDSVVNSVLPLVKMGGDVCVYGVMTKNPTFDLSKAPYNFDLHMHQWPTRSEEKAAMNTLAQWIEEGKLSASDFITHRFTIEEIEEAFAAYLDSASYKITGTKTKYTIKEGETLTRVSLRFYGTKAMWPYIVKHNPKVIKNPNNVPYGTTIEIPELTKE